MTAAPGDLTRPYPSVLGEVELLERCERAATARAIAAVQHPGGFVPHAAGKVGDPWNHLEAAMALASAGMLNEADRALRWSLDHQLADGSWVAELDATGHPLTERVDTNCVAYLAVAAWHRTLVTGDRSAAAELLAGVDRALGFVLDLQLPGGEVSWERDAAGRPGGYALVTASSSIHHSLLAGSALARLLGCDRPQYLAAASRLREALRAHVVGSEPGNFADTAAFAMDWYYPVLAGVLDGDEARAQLEAQRSRFVSEGLGVRCRADGRWVTTAETAECALAYARAGEQATAAALLSWTRQHREADGAYLTGLVHPERSEFPPGERSAYSAAAVLLADEALSGGPSAVTFGRLR